MAKSSISSVSSPEPALQIPFITNAGQIDREIAFYANTSDVTVFVTRDGEIVYALTGLQEGWFLKEDFVGDRESDVRGVNPAETLVNYYTGTDPTKWRHGLRTFRSVSLGQKYEFIDIQIVAQKEGVEKLFVVHPGGFVSDIRGRFENARSMIIQETGHLIVSSINGNILFTAPKAFQIKDGKHLEVEASYRVHGIEYGFAVGEYDPTLPLVIDPLLASSYLGGSRNETTYAVGTSGGDIIVAGTADSTDFPGLDEKVNVLGDAFIVRLDPDLSTVLAATYLGGSMTDGIRDIEVKDNVIYAAGYNNSPNFPTTPDAAYSGTSLSGSFVARFDTGTLRMTAATSFYANVFGLAWSPVGGTVYIAGSTGNTGFPISGGSATAFQTTHKGGADSFIAAFDEDLTTLKGATLLGGEGFDIVYDLTVDDNGYPVAAGITNSAAFPVSDNAFDSTYNLKWESTHQWIDGFVAKFTPDLKSLEASTYIGGGWNDSITTVKSMGSIIVAGGSTNSSDFPCASTFGPVDGNDAFLVLLNNDLSDMRSCIVFGGSRPGTGSPESVSDLAVHPNGSIFATGRTNASDFPTSHGAFLSRPSGSYYGAFIIAFGRDMSDVEASSLIHGGSEDLKAIALDVWGDVVVAGDTTGGGYPVTPGAVQPEHRGGDDLVISRLTPDLTGPHIELIPEILDFGHLPLGVEAREEIVVHNTGGSDLNIMDLHLTPESSAVFGVENPCIIIPAFDSCSIGVVFKPVLTGFEKGRLVVYSNDHFRGRVTIDLKGRAINRSVISMSENLPIIGKDSPPPRIKVMPDPCEFGEVKRGLNLTRTVSVTNIGGAGLHLKQAALEPAGVGHFAIVKDTCTGAFLEARLKSPDTPSLCEVDIVFAPAMVKKAEARLLLTSNDPSEPHYVVLLTGAGVDPEKLRYPGFWGWVAILILVLRMILGVPVSARGWGRWMNKRDKR
jgi:hypothetical protein